jgi:hypothetical protein
LAVAVLSFAGAGYFYFTRPYESPAEEMAASAPRIRIGAHSRRGFGAFVTSF